MKFLIAPALVALMAVPAQAEKLSLDAISAYLNGLGAAEASFTQVNDDNSTSTGRFMIKRPGRARFEYDPPEAGLVMAGSGQLAIFDKKSNEPPEAYPLRKTPLWVLLKPKVDLKRSDVVIAHEYDGTVTKVTAQDPDNPDRGALELLFTSDPVELRQWIMHDGAGGETTVVLGALDTSVRLPNSLFNVPELIQDNKPREND